MIHVTPTFALPFQCAAGRCAACCRAGWEIVQDEEALRRYAGLPGAAGQRVRDAVKEGPEPVLRFEHGQCVLLDPDGLCHLQRSFGGDALCTVCRDYPRFRRDFGLRTEHGLSLSCPEALRLAMDLNVPLTFWEAEDDAQVVPNDLDPDRYRLLLAGRETAFGILRDPALSFPRQLAALFDLARGLERELRRGGTRQPRRWVWTMRRPLPRYGELSRCRRLAQLARVYACLELLSPDWGEALAELESFAASSKEGVRRDDARAAFAADCRQDVYPRLLFWTLYKYWLDACDDGRLLPVLRRAAAGTLLAREMNRMRYRKDGRTDPLPVISSLCRETEHNEENLQALLDAAAALPCFRDEALILLSMP